MRLVVDGAGQVVATQTAVFTSLDVLTTNRAGLAQAFAAIGTVEDDHVWVDIAWLRKACASPCEEWQAGFDAMIDFATRKCWTRENRLVRAHVVSG